MDEKKVLTESEGKQKVSWSGIVLGFILGAFLFWLTIQVIALLMFSRTAA